MSRGTTNARLRAKLADEWIAREGLTRHPSRRMCGRCHRLIWAFLDPTYAGCVVLVDPLPTTALGEAYVAMLGLACWTIDPYGGALPWERVLGADMLDHPPEAACVHPPHVCSLTWPHDPARLPVHERPVHVHDAPPF